MATPTALDYAPIEVALVLHQGDDWEETFAFRHKSDPPGTYWDLTGWSGTCHIRDSYADDDDTVEPLPQQRTGRHPPETVPLGARTDQPGRQTTHLAPWPGHRQP